MSKNSLYIDTVVHSSRIISASNPLKYIHCAFLFSRNFLSRSGKSENVEIHRQQKDNEFDVKIENEKRKKIDRNKSYNIFGRELFVALRMRRSFNHILGLGLIH